MPTVLVIDGERAQYEKLQAALEEVGYTTVWTPNAAEAVHLAHREKPHLVLLDHASPGVDALEVTLLLKQDPATMRIPLLLLCARTAASLLESLDTDADMVLEKPVDPAELAVAAHCLLKRAGGR